MSFLIQGKNKGENKDNNNVLLLLLALTKLLRKP